MDLRETTPVLHPLVAELVADERLATYAEALPAPARVSEPALPLVLAALHEHLGRGLVCLLPEDADARDAADGARWFLGDERVALLPSRGVHWGSGLEPPPHLVGARARALFLGGRPLPRRSTGRSPSSGSPIGCASSGPKSLWKPQDLVTVCY